MKNFIIIFVLILAVGAWLFPFIQKTLTNKKHQKTSSSIENLFSASQSSEHIKAIQKQQEKGIADTNKRLQRQRLKTYTDKNEFTAQP